MDIIATSDTVIRPDSKPHAPHIAHRAHENRNHDNGAGVSDSVTISDEAKSLKESGNLSGIFDWISPDGNISITDLETKGREALGRFRSKLYSIMSKQGIDTGTPVDLGHAYGSGDIIVKNDHPDKEKIEALFKDDFELRNEFTKITNALHLAETGRQASAFQQAYRQDPHAAVAKYRYLFTTSLVETVHFESDSADVSFDRIPRA